MARKEGDKKPEEKGTKQLTLRLSSDLHTRLKLKCVREGRPMGEVLIELIREYLERS